MVGLKHTQIIECPCQCGTHRINPHSRNQLNEMREKTRDNHVRTNKSTILSRDWEGEIESVCKCERKRIRVNERQWECVRDKGEREQGREKERKSPGASIFALTPPGPQENKNPPPREALRSIKTLDQLRDDLVNRRPVSLGHQPISKFKVNDGFAVTRRYITGEHAKTIGERSVVDPRTLV